MFSRLCCFFGSVLLVGVAGCTVEKSTFEATFVVPDSLDVLADEHFLDHPFPSDLRRNSDGTVHYLGFYNPKNNALLKEYSAYADGLTDGFSPLAAGYLRFGGELDPSSLPANPTAALASDASVQLVDVDPSSSESGRRHLITLSYRAAEGLYVLPNTLRWMPTLGFPLRPHRTYALVVTTGVRGAAGESVLPSGELRQVLGLAPATGSRSLLGARWAPAIEILRGAGVPPANIAHLAVFTTSAPAEELFAVRDALRQNVPAPEFNFRVPWALSNGKNYVEYVASYTNAPNYQEGKLPFAAFGDGGSFHYKDGKPTVVDTFEPRFSLTVPNCAMPTDGYPIVLHAHGTGGDYRSHLSFATKLAAQCIASMGVDQIFHGTRPGAPNDPQETEILFFNFQNAEAARTNGRQSALDEVQRARLFTETHATIPATLAKGGKEIRFDGKKVMFFGHSQGGLNGPLFLASDDGALGGVLSGSGGTLAISLLGKTQPTPSVASLVRVIFLGLGPDDDELDEFHPAISLAQSVVDPVDPTNYARYSFLEPRPGLAPKSIYMTEGIDAAGVGDSYAPPKGIESHALAMGLPLAEPFVHPIAELAYGGPGTIAVDAIGIQGNLANGAATGALVQWAPPAGEDGHFVIYDVPLAQVQAFAFLRSLADEKPPRLKKPQ